MGKSEKFIIWCDKGMVFSFYALIYFLPISIALSETFTGTSLLFYLIKRGIIFYGSLKGRSSEQVKLSFFGKGKLFLRSYKPIESDLNWPIALFLFFNFVSVVTSQYPLLSAEGFLGKPLQSAFLYFTFIECINSRKRINIFLSIFLISCTLISVNGLYQYFVGQGFIHGYPYNGRVFSSFRHSNDFGAYLVVVVPLLLSLSVLTWVKGFGKLSRETAAKPDFKFLSSRIGKNAIFVLLLLGLACLGLTYSRGAWVAFSVAVLFLGKFDRRILLINITVLFLFFMVFYPKLTGGRGVNLITDSVEKEFIIVDGKKVKIYKINSSLNKNRYSSQVSKKLDHYANRIENIVIPEGGLDFGDADFTIDYWYYPTSIKNDDGHFSLMANIGNSFYLRTNSVDALELGRRAYDHPIWWKTFRHGFQIGQWYHIAVVRDGNFMHGYINGHKKVSIPISSKEKVSYKFAAIGFWDAGDVNTGFVHGAIVNFRITKGKMLFTSDFETKELLASMDESIRLLPAENIKTGQTVHNNKMIYSLNAPDRGHILVLHEDSQDFNSEVNFGRYFIDLIYEQIKVNESEERIVKIDEIEDFEKSVKSVDPNKRPIGVLQNLGGSGRSLYWREAINMIMDYPFFGVGLNTYSVVGRGYKISWGGYPHNCYLQMAVEIGLLGLVSFLWLLVVIFYKSIRSLSMIIHDVFLYKLLLGLLAGFGGFLIQSFFDTSFYSVQLGSLMWVIMGFIVATQRVGLDPD